MASDGGVFNYGDAHFYGSTGAIHLAKPIVGLASTADGKGYWFVATDGGVFNYGDAHFYGSTGSLHLKQDDRGHSRHARRQGLLARRVGRERVQQGRRPFVRLYAGKKLASDRGLDRQLHRHVLCPRQLRRGGNNLPRRLRAQLA